MTRDDLENRYKGLGIFPLSREHYLGYYGDVPLKKSIKGYVFTMHGQYAGIAGIEYRDGYYILFSEIKENAIVSKGLIFRCALFVMEFVKGLRVPVLATSNKCNERAHSFVKAMGFKEYSERDNDVFFYREAG
jgi:hypothetical protein